MFNLGTLLQVSALTMGVASATPISNAPQNTIVEPTKQQNDNIITDYSFSLTLIGTNTQNYTSNIRPNNQGISNYCYDHEIVKNYTTTTNYLNVIATSYETEMKYTPQGSSNTYYYFSNYAYYVNNGVYETSTRYLIVCQIDAYNYNIDTQTTLQLSYDFDVATFPGGDQIDVVDYYYEKNVYQTTENWSTYLQRQNAQYQAITIKNDIENANNNFYYTKETTLENADGGIDTTIINLVPKTRNYLVIEYIPIMETEYIEFSSGQILDTSNVSNLPLTVYSYNYSALNFEGTNIIPGGTYEVIDIPGLMWEILTMPFSFVSQAFNLTLFPGTPYQLNISNLFLSIIAVVVFVWLISFFLKLKG